MDQNEEDMEKTGRNDPCPCGSGKKFKKCCEAKKAQRKFHAEVLSTSQGVEPVQSEAKKVSLSLFQKAVASNASKSSPAPIKASVPTESNQSET